MPLPDALAFWESVSWEPLMAVMVVPLGMLLPLTAEDPHADLEAAGNGAAKAATFETMLLFRVVLPLMMTGSVMRPPRSLVKSPLQLSVVMWVQLVAPVQNASPTLTVVT